MRAVHGEAIARVVDVAPGGRTRRCLTVWDTAGPVGAPTLVLLHGVTLDADTNWSGCVPALARHFRVLALDLRGHGSGLPARVPYRLDDCADDVAAVVRALRRRARSSPSATRWAGWSRRCSGAGTAT